MESLREIAPMRRFEDRVVLVTGARTGIGLATVSRFTAEGATVIAGMRRPPSEERSDGAEPLLLDVTDEALWKQAMARIERRHGRLDVLVNNAGMRESGLAEETSLELWRRLIDANLTSVFLGCRAAIPLMRRNGGAIVNVGSITGIRGTEAMVAYSASKSGITSLTASLALDHARDGIRVNAVCPAAIDTRMVRGLIADAPAREAAWERLVAKHPMARIGTPDEVAGAIAFLASSDAGFITGQSIAVDGGRSIR